MADPLAQIVGLLRPGAPFSKCVTGSGPWRVRRTQSPNPYYVAVLKGSLRYRDHQGGEVVVNAGDFILIPSAQDFMMLSDVPSKNSDMVVDPVILPGGGYRVGSVDGPIDMRALVGYCIFQSDDAVLLSSLLPKLVVVRAQHRLAMLMELLGEEAVGDRPGREVVLQHLLEVLFIEALRTTAEPDSAPGLLRGLSDERLAVAIRRMHAKPGRGWTVAELARESALSRSGFHARFASAVGMAPMEYLTAWRLALAKDLLRRREASVGEIARQVGYRSASAFSVAFTRDVGVTPARYARETATALSGTAAAFEGAIA
ncbi:AraC family transcriptional regulator [Pelagibacterium xiamenense]|uniref:AraC family transcriptional regulator n=1 Tax=Pelagibacterium xiamenense TaxID=2901140 RepID=UPI001E36E128|nr:AraC family transcriptional regulator [Pelagibacterium xiamenense]MCD7058499.1 AraC family transcriptional regulator [Pelagibacterium xiamenense]